MANHLVYYLLFSLFVCVLSESNETEREVRIINGKTYFVQLRKIKAGDDEAVYVRTKTNLGLDNPRKITRFEDLYERLADIPEDLKERDPEGLFQNLVEDRRPSYIDKEWSYNPNHSSYDLPNITHEIYEAMLENNRHNTVVNASMVKFFFEVETNSASNSVRFNLDSLKTFTGRIIDAELHVYRLKRNETTKSSSSDNVVRLYQMTETSAESEETNSTTESTLNPDIHKLANVIYISSNYEGWQVFKVKNVIDNWRSGEENLGFLISSTDSSENEDLVEFAHRGRNGGKYQPTLIVYLDTHRKEKTPNASSRKPKPLRLSQMLSKTYNPCSRHIWYISFHELGWNNFIIAPTGYMANRCKGNCHSLAGAPYTNHGKLVSMLQQKERLPCCVPDSYKSLLVMFYDGESNVVIKEVEEMVVEGCSCR